MSKNDKNNRLDLGDAYNLGKPARHVEYYDRMAQSYDDEFVVEHRYIYPQIVAKHFLEMSSENDQPVADLGCGTGLVGEHFADRNMIIDGFDISPEMIRKAGEKCIYRNLQVADLTRPINDKIELYGGLISCGTFTLGHLGPQTLEVCLMLARPGAFCVIGINALHFRNEGFGEFFDNAFKNGKITKPEVNEVQIYESNTGADLIGVGKLVSFHMQQE
ncbi:MAG: methyltransferase domain-containing protein [Rhodobacteraceae bacterium]|nr:methyltransferase domain-containing protein [Paracoccaceae bacterium]MCY4249980.1 methyltransferase domain-containing protein [Paracoccaceae bacterium]MCY4307843.1 methyltransferase domain-containing protein [Paracoccaceae bacterium]